MLRTLSYVLPLSLCLLTVPALADGTWPHHRGPRYDGTADGTLGDVFGLAVDWRAPLKAGYSAIVVSGDRGVTLRSDGEDDVAVGFDVETGEETWRYRIAEAYKGHTGSSDGPISTPAIHDGRVYGLGPRGDLFALDLETGREIWAQRLDEKIARAPYYGFATAPAVAGDVVVVTSGGPDGHSVNAFDLDDGTLRWSVADEAVQYSSPAVAEIGGRRQVVAVNEKLLLGVDPANGELLWSHEHGTLAKEAFTTPLVLDGGRIFFSTHREAVMFQVAADGEKYKVEEVWRSRAFMRSYSVPVHHDGFLYGFSGRFLTCADAATGETRWKSRPPGNGTGLILVDGHLVIHLASGEVVVAEASPEGYVEKARLPVFETGGMTAPTFAGGHFFVRNLSEMARLNVTDTPTVVEETTEERQLGGALAIFIRRAEEAEGEERRAMVEEFVGEHASAPIVEPNGLVHFIYHGEVEDIAVQGSFLRTDDELPLYRLADTDLYFRSVELDPAGIYAYRFNVDFGKPTPDPRNPRPPVVSLLGPFSELRMPEAEAVDYDPDAEIAGRLDSFQFMSEALGGETRVRLYLPPGYARSGEKRYPLLVVFYGGSAVEGADLDKVLDHVIVSERAEPHVALLVGQSGMLYAGPRMDAWIQAIRDEILPHVEKHYRLLGTADQRFVYGPLDGGAIALLMAAENPGLFGGVAVQSPALMAPLDERLPAAVKQLTVPVYVEKRRLDFNFGSQMNGADHTEKLLEMLRGAGVDVTVRELVGAWDWPSWRAQLGVILGRFFPPPPEEAEE